eukprot:1624650-Rhodomonas_salina.2
MSSPLEVNIFKTVTVFKTDDQRQVTSAAGSSSFCQPLLRVVSRWSPQASESFVPPPAVLVDSDLRLPCYHQSPSPTVPPAAAQAAAQRLASDDRHCGAQAFQVPNVVIMIMIMMIHCDSHGDTGSRRRRRPAAGAPSLARLQVQHRKTARMAYFNLELAIAI